MRVRQHYLQRARAEPLRFFVVDTSQDKPVVQGQLIEAVRRFL
jgi:thymidylate kinase